MPFPSPVSDPQQTTLRTSGWWSRVLACLNPNVVIWRAQAAEAISSEPFITFDWDNEDIGSYESVWEGMVCFLSETANLRDAKYRGRVRLAPTATEFFIDKNSETLNIGTYIFVVRDTDLFSCTRDDALADGSKPYTPPAPQTNNLPYTVVLYDANNDTQETWTPVQSGVVTNAAASSIAAWSWDVSGDGASSIDDPTLEHPTFTFEAGYHYLVRVIYEDDVGTPNYQIIHVYAVTRVFDAPVAQPVATGSVHGSLTVGWTADLTAYGGVENIIGRTHVAVFHVQHFGDDSSTPIFDNLLMNGRIRSDSIKTEGSAEAGRVQSVTFTVEGITAYLRRLKIPNDIVRAVAVPDAWGEITDPTPYRMAVYAFSVYTTLTHLGSFGVEAGEFGDYIIGGEPRAIEGGVALDVLIGLLEPTIHAYPNFAPSGEITLAITTSYRVDHSGVETIATLGLQDLREYDVDTDSSRTVAQVVAFGGVYDSLSNAIILYTASAPSIIYGDGGEERELNKELLIVDSPSADATVELGLRASNDYAYNNPKPLADITLYDSYAGILYPTNYQRWVFILPASSNTKNVAYGEDDFWQLQSISLTINPDGTIDPSAEFVGETIFDDAQTLSDLLPNNAQNGNPVLPVLPNDPAFPTDVLENYPTTTPGPDDLQSIDPGSAAQAYTPFPPDVAAEVAATVGKPNCKVLNPNFKNSTNAESSWITILNAEYTMTLTGFTRIEDGTFEHFFDFTKSNYGSWAGDPTYWPLMNDYRDSAGYHGYVGTSAHMGGSLLYTPPTAFTADEIEIDLDSIGPGDVGEFNGISAGATSLYLALSTTPIPQPFIYNTAPVLVTSFGMSVIPGTPSGVLTIRSVTFRGGTGQTRYADAFYSWALNDKGEPIDILPLDDGLYLDNAQYTPVPTAPFPAFNPNHRYENLPFTGTGNSLLARMVFADYSPVQSAYLNIEMCRVQ